MPPTTFHPRLSTEETRRSLESFNWSLGYRTVFDTICAGTTFIFVDFALSLGLAKERMGFISSLVSFACIIQMVALIFTTRVKDKKRFILTVAVAEPIVMVAAVLIVPFLPAGVRLLALGMAVLTAAGALSLTSPLTQEWIASTIPAGVRGRYIGRRFQIMSIAVIVTTVIAGQIADHVSKTNTLGFGCILAVGGLFGIAAVAALGRATMPAVSLASSVEWADIPAVFRDRPFRRYFLAMLIYNFPFFFAVPYYQAFNLKVLGMRESHIGYMLAGYYVVRVVVTPLLGSYVDRKGAKWALLAFGPAYVLFFAGLMIATPGRIWPVVAAWLVAGLGDMAYSVAMTSALYESVPQTRSRPAFFAVYNLLALSTFGLGAIVAVPALEALKDVTICIGPLVLAQFQILFGVCMLLMVPCTFGGLLLARQGRGRQGSESAGPT